MKKILIIASLVLITNVGFSQHEHHNAESKVLTETKKKPASPHLSAMAMVGENHVHIEYGSPSVRGRNIWNGLVAYNQVWATGAHTATWIDFSENVMIEGKLIPKGKYGFFTIPTEDNWTLILSKTWDMHLADDYDQKNDVLRLEVKPGQNTQPVEALTYEVLSLGENKGKVKMSWEKLNVSLDFKNVK